MSTGTEPQPQPTHVTITALELQALNNLLDAGANVEAKVALQRLAVAYGLPPLPGGAEYGVDLDTGEVLAP